MSFCIWKFLHLEGSLSWWWILCFCKSILSEMKTSLLSNELTVYYKCTHIFYKGNFVMVKVLAVFFDKTLLLFATHIVTLNI